MSHTLIVLRHAKSSWATHDPDHRRPLAARGRRDAAVAGGIYAALLSTRPEALGYTAALGAASVTALAAVGLSRRIGRIPNEL